MENLANLEILRLNSNSIPASVILGIGGEKKYKYINEPQEDVKYCKKKINVLLS